MSRLVSIFGALTLLLIVAGCNQKAPTRIVSQRPVKTEILGLKLCEKTDEEMVAEAIEEAIGDYVMMEVQSVGTGKTIRALPVSMSFSFGGCSWMYIDVSLDGDDNIVGVSLNASYENIDNAKRQYEDVVSTFEYKYGKGNVFLNGHATFWTDDVNSIGIEYKESASINGKDRSFCSLHYFNVALADKLNEQNMSDI